MLTLSTVSGLRKGLEVCKNDLARVAQARIIQPAISMITLRVASCQYCTPLARNLMLYSWGYWFLNGDLPETLQFHVGYGPLLRMTTNVVYLSQPRLFTYPTSPIAEPQKIIVVLELVNGNSTTEAKVIRLC